MADTAGASGAAHDATVATDDRDDLRKASEKYQKGEVGRLESKVERAEEALKEAKAALAEAKRKGAE